MAVYNKCILLADEDSNVKTLLSNGFDKQQCTFHSITPDLDLNHQAINFDANLALIDINYYGLTIENADKFFRAHQHIPIITMSDTIDRNLWIAMVEAGAEEHLFKPLNVKEVCLRMSAVLRRCGQLIQTTQLNGSIGLIPTDQPCSNNVFFDRWIVNPEKYEVTALDGEPCQLTSGDFTLLMIFMKNAHRVLSRDDIMDALHGHEWSPFDRSIDNQISRLRKKIENDPTNPKIIKTIRGAGYAFVSDIEKFSKS